MKLCQFDNNTCLIAVTLNMYITPGEDSRGRYRGCGMGMIMKGEKNPHEKGSMLWKGERAPRSASGKHKRAKVIVF